MATKKNNPNVQKRVAERKAFVAARPEMDKATARKRFYVQTRAKELEAAGKTVDRAALRKKFEMGDVKREGFLTPQDVQRAAARRAAAASASSATLPAPGASGRTAPAAQPFNPSRTTRVTANRGSLRDAGFVSSGRDLSAKKKGNADRLLGNIVGGIKSVVEPVAATFIAPAWNSTVGSVKPSLRMRETKGTEKLVTGVSFFLGGGAVSNALRKPTTQLALGAGSRGALGSGVRGAIGPGPRALPAGPKPPAPRPSLPGRTPANRLRAQKAFESLREAEKKIAEQATAAAKKTAAPVKATAKKASGKKAPNRPAGKYQTGGMSDKAADQSMKKFLRAEKKAFPNKKASAKKAPAKKSAAPKASAPVKAPAKQTPKQITSTGRTSTSAGPARTPVRAIAPSTTKRFASQEAYNKFMDTGGKEVLRRMSPREQEAFTQLNKGWIVGRSRAAGAQAASRAKAAEQRARAVAVRNKNMLSRMRKKGLTFTE